MSRIGKIPVTIPAGVKVNIAAGMIEVEGPKGKLNQHFTPNVSIEIKDNEAFVSPVDSSASANAAQGLYRNLLRNMVIGVTDGFSKSLIINGVGYRAEVQGKMLVMNLGYSTDFAAVTGFIHLFPGRCCRLQGLRHAFSAVPPAVPSVGYISPVFPAGWLQYSGQSSSEVRPAGKA